MANRYWVGGTATWDNTAGTKWAATSGGAGGASVPTNIDDVFFDANSTGVVTIGIFGGTAKSVNCTGFTGTLTGSTGLNVSGSVTLVAGMTYSVTGPLFIDATGTLITAGKTLNHSITFSASGGTVTLGDALTLSSTRTLVFSQGTFDTANFSVTAGFIDGSTSFTRAITLGSSTITLNGIGNVIDFTTTTGLTFTAGTSQINITDSAPTLIGGGRTFYNVSFTSATAGIRSITGTNTFNNLTLTASALGLSTLELAANQTVNGAFTSAGSSALARGFVSSGAVGTQRTITAASISAADCDFRDILLAGAAAGASPTRAGDCGGNSGITFPAAKTVYRVGTNTTWSGSASWATSTGGAGADTNFPLAQDTAVIDNSTTLTGTLAIEAYNVGGLSCSTRTTGITLSYATACSWYGSHILGSGITVSGTTGQTFFGRSTATFTSAGKTITFPITVNAPGGSFVLGDAFNSTAAATLTRGTFNANNFNVTCTSFASSNSITRTVTMGSGLWTLSGTGTIWNFATITGLTFNKNTADIFASSTSTASRTFTGGGLSYNKLTIGGTTGTSTFIISNANSFTELASTKTVAHTVTFSANQGTIDTWSITGSAGNVVTVNSSVAGTQRTFALTNVTSGINYLSVKDIGVTTVDKFLVGVNSTDGGNNTNVYFIGGGGTGNMFMLLW